MPNDSGDQRDYDRARDAFDNLKPEDQARFLFETTASAVSRGATNVSRALADELENIFRKKSRSGSGKRSGRDAHHARHEASSSETSASGNSASEQRDAPGPAEPPTDARQAPGGGPQGEST